MSCSGTRSIRPLGCLPLRAGRRLVCIPWTPCERTCAFTCSQEGLRWSGSPQRDEDCDCSGSRSPPSLLTRRVGRTPSCCFPEVIHQRPGTFLSYRLVGEGYRAASYPSTHLRLGIAPGMNVCSALLPPEAHCAKPPITDRESGPSYEATSRLYPSLLCRPVLYHDENGRQRFSMRN